MTDRPCCPLCKDAGRIGRYAGRESYICYGCSNTFDTPADLRVGGGV